MDTIVNNVNNVNMDCEYFHTIAGVEKSENK